MSNSITTISETATFQAPPTVPEPPTKGTTAIDQLKIQTDYNRYREEWEKIMEGYDRNCTPVQSLETTTISIDDKFAPQYQNIWVSEESKEVIYIVAGTIDEFREYQRKKYDEYYESVGENINNPRNIDRFPNYIFVHFPEQLRGIINLKGFFIGSWKDRYDIEEIKTIIATSKR